MDKLADAEVASPSLRFSFHIPVFTFYLNSVDSCPEHTTLPSLSWLKSLKHLELRCCPKILSLPSDGLPASLESFIVIDCPELKEWCCMTEGEDWRKICHLPSIWFDCEEERCAGADTLSLVDRILHRSKAHLQTMLFQKKCCCIVEDFYVNLVDAVPDLIEQIHRKTARLLLHINGGRGEAASNTPKQILIKCEMSGGSLLSTHMCMCLEVARWLLVQF